MAETLIELFPSPGESVRLEGLYLALPLPPADAARPIYVYTNFVQSLDGRIAVAEPSGQTVVPDTIANPRDWRLFQELAAHADVLLTSGRYLRDLAAGVAQDSLPLSTRPPYADLIDWRRARGMPAQPDIAVMSRSLDFELPRQWFEEGRRVLVLTTAAADPAAVAKLEAQGAEVVRVETATAVSGADAVEQLACRGYRRLYAVAGPYVLRSLLADQVVDTLFLTTVHRLVGGSEAPGFLEGPALPGAVDLRLTSLYLDPHAHGGLGQSLARYDRAE